MPDSENKDIRTKKKICIVRLNIIQLYLEDVPYFVILSCNNNEKNEEINNVFFCVM